MTLLFCSLNLTIWFSIKKKKQVYNYLKQMIFHSRFSDLYEVPSFDPLIVFLTKISRFKNSLLMSWSEQNVWHFDLLAGKTWDSSVISVEQPFTVFTENGYLTADKNIDKSSYSCFLSNDEIICYSEFGL